MTKCKRAITGPFIGMDIFSGTRVVTRHYRPNMDPNEPNDDYLELPYLNWDNHYSTHYQEIRQLKVW